ncbi:MAG: hypothetical protein AAGG47_21160 [Pseudomonadota bacterium]
MRFRQADRGAVTLDWVTLVATLLVLSMGVFFSVGGDVRALTSAIGLEASEEVAAAGGVFGARDDRPVIKRNENEPLRVFDPGTLQGGGGEQAAMMPYLDRPMGDGASGAFEPALAEPRRTNAAPQPELAFREAELTPMERGLRAAVTLETDAPRAACPETEQFGGVAGQVDENQWVSGILEKEVRCREAVFGESAEPDRPGKLSGATLFPPKVATSDEGLSETVAVDVSAPRAEGCADRAPSDDTHTTDWLGGVLAEEVGCEDAAADR